MPFIVIEIDAHMFRRVGVTPHPDSQNGVQFAKVVARGESVDDVIASLKTFRENLQADEWFESVEATCEANPPPATGPGPVGDLSHYTLGGGD